MPELPEVQTIVSDLNRKIKGDTITDFWSDAPKSLKNISIEKFRKEIKNRKILGAHRIGKNMFIDLNGGKTIYIHLKMTGHLLVKIQDPNDKVQIKSKVQNPKKDYFQDRVNQYIHHIWSLKSRNTKHITHNKTLEFSDMRKFAKIVLLETKDLKNYKDIKPLGIDAVSQEFSLERFEEMLNKKQKTPIGILLMDQSLIAGIGNIYRGEILYDALVNPIKMAGELSDKDRKKIYKSILKVLQKAIKFRGTSDSDYRDTSGAPGGFQKVLKVYRREKQKCPKCATMVRRMKLGGRSVFYCEKCQK